MILIDYCLTNVMYASFARYSVFWINILSSLFVLFLIVPSNASPNIILLLADDLGYCEIEPYPCISPHGRMKTPNLVKFSEEAMIFTDAYAGVCVCAPSRCSLMTGKHTGHSTIRGNVGINGHDMPLLESDITVAQVLKSANYDTALIGKWGLGYNGSTGAPRKKGFDYYFGQLDQNEAHNYYPPFVWENENKLELPSNKNASRERCMHSPRTCNYTHEMITQKALEYLENRVNSTNPFFLYLAYTVPHAGGWKDYDETGEPVPSNEPYSNTSWPDVEKDHAAMITSYLDADIGKIMHLLYELGMDDNTIVFFTSDNGAHNEGGHNYKFFNSSGPFSGFKRSLYEGGIRSPMMVRWPRKVPPGVHNGFVWSFWDFLPTAAELANVKSLPNEIDGISIVPTLLGKHQAPKEFLYWEFCTNQQWGHAVRVGPWKSISFSVDEPLSLFYLPDDISESKNVADKFPSVIKMMEQISKEAHVDNPKFPIENCASSLGHGIDEGD